MIRAFIAFELPRRVTAAIAEIQKHLKQYLFNVRWVRPDNIHLTLKFLGDIKTTDIDTVGDAVENAADGFSPFSLEASGVGVFPNMHRPRVLWTGIAGQTAQLQQLHEAVEQRLESIGFPKETRPFRGHLTLGRIKGNIAPRSLHEAVAAHQGFQSGLFAVDRLYVFKSDLKPTGSEYTKLCQIEITGGKTQRKQINRRHE